MPSIEYLLTGASVLLLLSIISSKFSGRLGVPAVLLFIIIGMLAGAEGIGKIQFDDPWLAQSLGVAALALILFSGGLDTEWKSVRPVVWKGLALSTVGVFLTALLVAWFTIVVLDLSLHEGLLLGAIVSSTDAAAVFAVLRSRKVSLKGELKPLLELESGSNDPTAVFLTIGMIRLIGEPTLTFLDMVLLFVQQMAIGAAMGFLMARGITYLLNHLKLEYEGLYPVLTFTMVFMIYGLTAIIGGNGFLAVYLAGLLLANSDFIHKKSLVRFHDGIAWLMQIIMFLTLGLLVMPSHLSYVWGVGIFTAAFLILMARPLSVFIALLPWRMKLREKAMVMWVGLRGAVPIILATFPMLSGIEQSEMIFNVVFFIVMLSVVVQGTTIPFVARLLRVDSPLFLKARYPLEFEPAPGSKGELVDIFVPHDSFVTGKRLLDIHFPKGVLVALILRNDEYLVPGGQTIIEAGDLLLILADTATLAELKAFIGRKKEFAS